MVAVVEPGMIQVAGQTVRLRRLNVKDVFAVGRIITVALTRGGQAVSNITTVEDFIQVMVASVPYTETEVIRFCSGLIGMTEDDFCELPPEALLDVFEALKDSEDLKAFLARCSKLLGLNLQTA